MGRSRREPQLCQPSPTRPHRLDRLDLGNRSPGSRATIGLVRVSCQKTIPRRSKGPFLSPSAPRRLGLLAALALLTPHLLSLVEGQEFSRRAVDRFSVDRPARTPAASQADSFQFVRIEYDSLGGWQEAFYEYEGRIWQRWETDFPQADENFLFRLAELIPAKVHPSAQTVTLSDPELFSFPFIYMCDVGWMELSNEEARNLRTYLEKGGFLWVDDFWGAGEWANLERNMRRVFPDREWRDLGKDHGILSSVFPLEGVPQVPARDFFPQTHDPPWIHRYPAYGVDQVHLRGWFDDQDRLLAVASYNTDIGDGWEREGYGEAYFTKYSTVAYAFGTNVVVYALTH